MFDCPFCGKTDACGVSMDFDHKVGVILCDGCGARYESRIHRLTDPIDVYAEWIDKCANTYGTTHMRDTTRRTLALAQVRGGEQWWSRKQPSWAGPG